MDRALDGKVAMVTGAASGIARAAALSLSREGAAIAALDRNAEGLASLVAEISAAGGRAIAITIDLAEPARCAPAVEEAIKALGRIDVLVNGAGIDVGQGDFLDMPEAKWELSHNVNLRSPMLLMQAAARQMVAQGDGGRIVNVTSSAAFRASTGMAPYAAAKAGLTQLTRNLAAELGAHGINVNAVAPGVTATPMSLGWFGTKEKMQEEAKPGGSVANLLHRVSDPEDVAAAIVFLCLPAGRQMTGQTLHPSAGTVV